jgi:hypothetical protein
MLKVVPLMQCIILVYLGQFFRLLFQHLVPHYTPILRISDHLECSA